MRIIAGGLQPPIVEAERLCPAILEIQLPILRTAKRIGGQLQRGIGLKGVVIPPI
jgi:hypothetical protein